MWEGRGRGESSGDDTGQRREQVQHLLLHLIHSHSWSKSEENGYRFSGLSMSICLTLRSGRETCALLAPENWVQETAECLLKGS